MRPALRKEGPNTRWVFQGTCWSSGKRGHLARDFWARSAQNNTISASQSSSSSGYTGADLGFREGGVGVEIGVLAKRLLGNGKFCLINYSWVQIWASSGYQTAAIHYFMLHSLNNTRYNYFNRVNVQKAQIIQRSPCVYSCNNVFTLNLIWAVYQSLINDHIIKVATPCVNCEQWMIVVVTFVNTHGVAYM